mgnify:FL=1
MIVTIIVGLIWQLYSMFNDGAWPVADWLTNTYAVVIATALAMFVFTLIFPRRPEERIDDRSK